MRKSAFAITTATLIAFAGSAQAQTPAQTGQLSEDQVKSFFAQIQQQVTQLVQQHDNQAITQWENRNVADSAHFKISSEVTDQGQPKMWSVMDLGKADMEHMRPMMGEQMLRSIQNYSLQIQVSKVTPHGPDAATATVTWNDTVRMAMPSATATSGQAQNTSGQSLQSRQAQGGGQMIEIKRSYNCDQLVVREQQQLKLGLSTCTGSVHF